MDRHEEARPARPAGVPIPSASPAPRRTVRQGLRRAPRGPLAGLRVRVGRAFGVALLAVLLAAPAVAQGPERDGLRLGIGLGGISSASLLVEYRWGNRSLDLAVGTVALRDLSVSLVGKQYLGDGYLQPFLGVGLWTITAFQEDGTGVAFLVRAPVGADWRLRGDHYLGLSLAINRALAIRRPDPEDTEPPRSAPVPLPGLYYRWAN